MFLGLRDIRFAKGRFALMATVIGLITMLLVLLSGLTAGLGNQSTSAVADLAAKSVVFNTPKDAKPSFTESAISPAQQATWQEKLGGAVQPLGISQARAEASNVANVTVFGSQVAPELAGTTASLAKGQVFVDATTAQALGVLESDGQLTPDNSVKLNGQTFTVSGLTPEAWYSHMPVMWMGLEDWQALTHTPDTTVGTVLTVLDKTADQDQITALASETGTTALTPKQSFAALSSYSSENGSLMMMQAFLYGISALVIAAFLAVWTVQRTRDIAVLKALGAANRYVVFDSLVQAAVALVAGTLVGGLIGLFAGFGAQQVAPFLITAGTFAIPVLGVMVLGMAASVAAVRGATRINPLIALGGN
ncbi:FtsX-like permease family protein [Jonesiaceae bacterium BS-20]|uniref:FtsX-like permease family protein n=1 Tax=Jonesiaceae bacterium BS-20 TaxID=3120821 RepID=A0AAU7DUZ5_9MICO